MLKLSILISLCLVFFICSIWSIGTPRDAPPALRVATVLEDNPGLIDDFGCRTLIVQQLKAQGQKLEDWIIEYYNAREMPDGLGGANIYHLTSRKTGEIWEVGVGFHSQLFKAPAK